MSFPRVTGFRIAVALLLLVLALATVLLISALTLGKLEADTWIAIGNAATVFVAVASVVALAGLLLIWDQTETHRHQSRIESGPYLRVDFAPDSMDGTWSPPQSVDERFMFDWNDFNPSIPEPPSLLDAWRKEAGFDLCIWLTNKQTAPGGTAINILITTEIDVTESDHETTATFPFELKIHYLEPGRSIRYRLATLDPEIPYLRGRVTGVTYWNAYEQPLAFSYGATEFEWNGLRIDNQRRYFKE